MALSRPAHAIYLYIYVSHNGGWFGGVWRYNWRRCCGVIIITQRRARLLMGCAGALPRVYCRRGADGDGNGDDADDNQVRSQSRPQGRGGRDASSHLSTAVWHKRTYGKFVFFSWGQSCCVKYHTGLLTEKRVLGTAGTHSCSCSLTNHIG